MHDPVLLEFNIIKTLVGKRVTNQQSPFCRQAKSLFQSRHPKTYPHLPELMIIQTRP